MTAPTQGQIDSVLFLAEQDFSPAETAGIANLTVAQVRGILKTADSDAPAPEAPRRTGRPSAMTPEQIEQALSMRSDGQSYRQIGEALGFHKETVRASLHRLTESENAEPAPDETPPTGTADAEETWPPPASEASPWRQLRTRPGTYPVDSTTVRVRPVRLWGKEVLIDDREMVWCPDCLEFKTIAQLSHPWNACRVGLPRRGGLLMISEEQMVAESYTVVESEVDRALRSGW